MFPCGNVKASVCTQTADCVTACFWSSPDGAPPRPRMTFQNWPEPEFSDPLFASPVLSILSGFRSSACVFLDLFVPLPSPFPPPIPLPSCSSPPPPSSFSCYWCFSLNSKAGQEPQCLHGTDVLPETQKRRRESVSVRMWPFRDTVGFGSFVFRLPSLSCTHDYTQTLRHIHGLDGWS